MTLARRPAAARHALAIMLALMPAVALAGDISLQLPVTAVLALTVPEEGRKPPQRRRVIAFASTAAVRPLSLLPSELHIPDLYAVDVDRDPRQYVAPIDNDRMVSLDLMSRRHGWKTFVAYDTEDRGPFPGGSTRLSVVAEFRFH